METARDVVRLILETELSNREIAVQCRVSHVSVATYRRQVKTADLDMQTVQKLNDTELKGILKSKRGRKKEVDRPEPDFEQIHKDLKKKGVTLQLLWKEYIENHPNGYRRSRFCELYQNWRKPLNL